MLNQLDNVNVSLNMPAKRVKDAQKATQSGQYVDHASVIISVASEELVTHRVAVNLAI